MCFKANFQISLNYLFWTKHFKHFWIFLTINHIFGKLKKHLNNQKVQACFGRGAGKQWRASWPAGPLAHQCFWHQPSRLTYFWLVASGRSAQARFWVAPPSSYSSARYTSFFLVLVRAQTSPKTCTWQNLSKMISKQCLNIKTSPKPLE